MNMTKNNLKRKCKELKEVVKKTVDKVSVLKSLENIIKKANFVPKLFTKILKLKNKLKGFFKNQSFSKILVNKTCNVSLKLLNVLMLIKDKL
jgi:hypothetical protein